MVIFPVKTTLAVPLLGGKNVPEQLKVPEAENGPKKVRLAPAAGAADSKQRLSTDKLRSCRQ
jgi:hypothetical protein